jgi:hypothetical protein
MFGAFGVAPARGYEFLHFDRERNRKSGIKVFRYEENRFAWREVFHAVNRSACSKLPLYIVPVRGSERELSRAEEALFDSTDEVVLAHLGSTNGMQILHGDEKTTRFVVELDEWIERVRRRHEEERGRPLRVVMLSDHGNSSTKVRGIRGVRKRLRRAGLRVVKHLEGDGDVVAPTFGLVGYGSLFVAPVRAEAAARAVVTHPAVALAAWISAPSEMTVVSAEGEARVRWREAGGLRAFAYESIGTDPLGLAEPRARLARDGRMDRAGFAGDRDWFEASLGGPYPDPLHRLVDSLEGSHVVHRATVIFSLEPGRSWGLRWARWLFWLRGGRMEGTHGGLDAASSTGFFMATDPSLDPGFALRPEWALGRVAGEQTPGQDGNVIRGGPGPEASVPAPDVDDLGDAAALEGPGRCAAPDPKRPGTLEPGD